MRLLLDTHVFLWSIADRQKLTSTAWALLENPANQLAVSAVSIWEISIKFAQRRGRPDDMPMNGHDALAEIAAAGFDLLAVNGHHAAAVDQLPLHHRDPFDRLLVAQAKAEPIFLVTHDAKLAAYGDCVLIV